MIRQLRFDYLDGEGNRLWSQFVDAYVLEESWRNSNAMLSAPDGSVRVVVNLPGPIGSIVKQGVVIGAFAVEPDASGPRIEVSADLIAWSPVAEGRGQLVLPVTPWSGGTYFRGITIFPDR